MNYKLNVLAANSAIKIECKTLNGALKLTKIFLANKDEFKETLDALEKIGYPMLKKHCRKSKSGNYTPFYILQAVYKLNK